MKLWQTIIWAIFLSVLFAITNYAGFVQAETYTAKHCDREGIAELDGTMYECHAIKVTTGDD